MIGARTEALDDLRPHAGIERRAGDDLLEQIGGHAARAGEGHQQPARAQQLEREQVDVLVGARRRLGMRGGRRELGRVEDDQVELAARVAQAAQLAEHVAVDPFAPRGRSLALRRSHRASRSASAELSMARTDGRRRRARCDAEAAGVAEAVEHVAAGRELSRAPAVVALVQVEPGLVAVRQIDRRNGGRLSVIVTRAGSAGPCSAPTTGGKSFQLPHVRIRTLPYALDSGRSRQGIRRSPGASARRPPSGAAPTTTPA